MGLDALSSIFIAIGFIAGLTGLGLMYYSLDDEQRNDGWLFSDADRTEENQQRYDAGRLLSLGGLIVLAVGVVLAAARR